MVKPVRVLHVFAQMNRSGAETLIMNIYRNIDRTKVQFDFIKHTDQENDYDDEIMKLGGKIYTVPRYTGKNHMLYKNAWHTLFNEHPNYKLIHGHVRSTASIYLKIAKRYQMTTIAHSHSTSSGSGFSAFAKNVLQYPIRNIADYLFACSTAAGNWLFGKHACENKKFFIINNAIDTEQYIFSEKIRETKRNELGIQDEFVIGHVGRFDPAKNQSYLIDLFKDVYDQNPNTVLLMVGDGILREIIEKKVNKLGLNSNVIFTGTRSDIPDILMAMDVFVFPSLYEGLGIAVVEAQAAGLPCIVSEGIPKEAYVTDLIESISLNRSSDYWGKAILQYYQGHKRINTIEEIQAKGYDIHDTAKWLQQFYLSKMEE